MKSKEEQMQEEQQTKPIIKMGNPILHSKAQEIAVEEFGSKEIQDLVEDLKMAMTPTHASGIAAPQIGVNKRLIIFGYDKLKNYPEEPPVPFTVLINPKYTIIDSDDKVEVWEHCLSIPKMRGKTIRYNRIKYSGYQQDGAFIEREAAGIHSILVQHEIDHLDGILFNQKILDNSCFGFIEEFERANILLGMKPFRNIPATQIASGALLDHVNSKDEKLNRQIEILRAIDSDDDYLRSTSY
jgi:peptide deformylase